MVQYSFNFNKTNNLFPPEKLPTLIYVGQIHNEPEWFFPSHKHDDLSELIFISEGEGTFIVNDKTYTAKKGDILIYNKGVIHEEFSNPSNPLKTYFCGIGNLYINDIEEGNIIPSNVKPIISSGDYANQIESFLSDIFRENQKQDYGYETICQHLLISIITIIIRLVKSQNRDIALASNENSLGYRIKKYIENNYMKDLTLKDIAGIHFISPNYVSHVFKKENDYSPIQYLINCRIGEARRLLLTTDLKVQEIAKYVGYDNPNYFTMIFKDTTGDSPTQFRKNNTRTKLTPQRSI